jgi:predicted ATPase/DNA-binding SARP family transcriptional activator/DNA-binding CsgD family transcriptional regulator
MAGPERSVAEQQRPPRSTEAPGGEPEVVRLWLLGAFEVSVGHRSIGKEDWRLKKAGGLLKLLALAPGHRLRREQAMELLWPGLGPEAAANNLHYALHVARRTLEPAAPGKTASRYLTLRGDLLALCPDGPLWVDVEAFERAAATARRSRDPAAYRAAVELYVGDLLPEDRYEEWAEEKREQLRSSYHVLLLELAGLHEEREEYGPAIETLRRAAAEEPTREEAHAVLMRLYALTGRRQEAILQYERLRNALRGQLDEEPGAETKRLLAEIRAGKVPAAPSPPVGRPSKELLDPSPNNLPAPLTSFVGREQALLEVKRLLSMTRLLTLTGAGGAGKTRLALEVARDLFGAYPEGVWLVELAPLSDPALTPQAVAEALGVREQPGRPLTDALTDHLWAKDSLLVLDNCEHLVDAAAHLAAALLGSCPKLRILATSREPLGVSGEVSWPVPPLSLPDTKRGQTSEGLLGCEAVRLFVERAGAVAPGFVLTRENGPAVADLCLRLDGVPLAIELAASRVRILSVGQILARLDDRFRLLSGNRTAVSRHRTLGATIGWSHELLSEEEKILFRRLSVFAGGWTLEEAERVCAGDGIEEVEVLDLLSRLVDKSLVLVARGDGESRYGMLETVGRYASEKLRESGEAEAVGGRHADFFMALAEQAKPAMVGPEQAAWMERLEKDHDNLRAALGRLAEEGEAERGLRLAAALTRFWWFRGNLTEGRAWLEGMLGFPATPVRDEVRAKALRSLGALSYMHAEHAAGAWDVARRHLQESLKIYRRLGDEQGAAAVLQNLGRIGAELGEWTAAFSFLDESLAIALRLGNRPGIASSLFNLGYAQLRVGDLPAARAHLEEGLGAFRELDDRFWIAACLVHLGYIDCEDGEYAAARSRFIQMGETIPLAQFSWGATYTLDGFARLAAAEGEAARALRLGGATTALRRTYGVTIGPTGQDAFQRSLVPAWRALGEEGGQTAWEEGLAMTLEEAIGLAYEEPGAKPDRTSENLLTSRELEIAVLVARGLTNRKVASELSVSERTVANHVGKILKKLGFSSRALIAAWIARR